MKRSPWLLLSVVLLIVALCCCLTFAGAGTWLLRWARTAPDTAYLPPAGASEPTPVPLVVRRPPSALEVAAAARVDQTPLPERDLFELASRFAGGMQPPLQLGPSSQSPWEPGDRDTFWIHNEESASYFSATAALAHISPHAYWWVEGGFQVLPDDLERSASTFELSTYPTNHRIFGSEPLPGIDGDPRLHVFLGNVPGVGGCFSGSDEYPSHVSPYSNLREILYVNLNNAMPGNAYFDGVLAHELEHMILWQQDRNEDTWLNEGLAELAIQMNGYELGDSHAAFSLFPDTQLTAWPEMDFSAPHYGASHLFVAYLQERFGEAVIGRLVAEPENGIAGIEAALKGIDPQVQGFTELFADWTLANYLDDPRSADGRYGYSEIELHPPAFSAHHSAYPVSEVATVHQYAADYILLEGEGDITVEFTGSLLVPLVGPSPYSGDLMWWSNRGDESDTTLTRRLDLRGVSQATLQAAMWYDLEQNYDYAYVGVSTDNGMTWSLLSNAHTAAPSLAGNSYGPAFTGISGGGASPAWVTESFDLTPYTTREILVRFEVITDDSVNKPGLCLDDIRVPELGFLDDAETSDQDWQARGWLRIPSHIPQSFVVQLITLGRRPSVHRLTLDDQMHGLATFTGAGQPLERAVLVVSGVTPHMTEWASYSYRISRE